MKNLGCNQILLEEQPCGVWISNTILYFYLLSFFNFCNFLFVDNMILWVLIAKMLG